MSEKDDRKIKYCVYCGEELESDEVYCPNCGKLVVKAKTKPASQPLSPKVRKCPNCGSLVESNILKECPICRTRLKEPPRRTIEDSEKRTGLIFTEDRLESEEKFIIKREQWKIKEGMGVLYTSIFVYFIILSFLLFLLQENDIFSILLFNASEIALGLYPLWYIYNNKHTFDKIGFNFDKKNLITALFIGISGGLLILLIDWIQSFFISLITDTLGLTAVIQASITILKSSELFWIILLVIIYALAILSKEILFRGVLHNTLIERFGDDVNGKFIVIILVALGYSALFALFNIPIGLLYFIPYTLMNIILGIVYELSERNIFATICASMLYNYVSLILILVL